LAGFEPEIEKTRYGSALLIQRFQL
jgi:hypothetical protein